MVKHQSGTATPPSRQSDVLYRVSTYVARRSGMRDAARDERETRQQDRAPRLDRGPAVHVLQAAPGDPARLDPSRVYRVTTPGVADRLVARMKNAAGSLQVVDIATGLTAGAAHDAVTIADTASVNLNLTGQLLSADVMYGGTGGNSGGSSAAARFDHAHSGVYQPAGSYQPLDQDLTDIAAVSGVRGDLLMRGATAWQRLGAGSSGQVLTAAGVAADLTWAAPGGITVADSASIDLTLATNQITAAAIFGTTATTVAAGNHAHAGVYQPVDQDLTDLAGIAGVQGDVIVRGASAWQRLAPGTSGQFLQTLGAAANPAWATPAAGGGTLTVQEEDVTTASAVTTLDFDGSDFNTTSEAGNEVRIALAYGTTTGTPAEGNHTHAAYQPLDTDLTDIAAVAGIRGDLLMRGATAWQRLAAGTSGQVLTAAGAAADLAWAAPGGITVADTSSIDLTLTGSQVSAAAIFGSTATTVAAGNHGHSGVYQPLDADLTDLAAISGVQGDVLVRGATAWQRLGAGTSGQFLQTLGAGATPAWAAASAASSDIALIRSADFTSVASVIVDGVFSSTYDEYDIMITVDDCTVGATFFMQLRAAGVTASAANYDYSGAYNFNNAPANNGHNQAAGGGWFIGSLGVGAIDLMSHILMASPARARKTRYESFATYYSTPSTVTQTVTSFGGHRLASAYDGFIISGAGVSMSGNVRVYGRRRV